MKQASQNISKHNVKKEARQFVVVVVVSQPSTPVVCIGRSGGSSPGKQNNSVNQMKRNFRPGEKRIQSEHESNDSLFHSCRSREGDK